MRGGQELKGYEGYEGCEYLDRAEGVRRGEKDGRDDKGWRRKRL